VVTNVQDVITLNTQRSLNLAAAAAAAAARAAWCEAQHQT
jgi:hypothetical protein